MLQADYYGRTACQKLAIRDPDAAINNADSYRLYAIDKENTWAQTTTYTSIKSRRDLEKTVSGLKLIC